MRENEERRQANRQQRGLLRSNEILRAAGTLFAEIGYDKVTTNMIAERAGVSPGSLYQFFPNKEAIAHAYAAQAVVSLHQVYDTILAPQVVNLPLPVFIDTFIDALLVFNREYAGYLALSLASTISSSLALVLADLHGPIFGRMETMIAAIWPASNPEQRRLPGLVSYRLFLALLPLAISGDEEQQRAVAHELKVVMYRYWQPIVEGVP